MGFGQDPNSGEQLGRPYRKFATATERVGRRVEKLSDALADEERAAQAALIEAEESPMIATESPSLSPRCCSAGYSDTATAGSCPSRASANSAT